MDISRNNSFVKHPFETKYHLLFKKHDKVVLLADNNTHDSFKFKTKITGQTSANDKKLK